MTVINGIEVRKVAAYREQIRDEPQLADRRRTSVAHWLGGARSEIVGGGASIHLGGEGQQSAMQVLLGSLAACEVHLLAMHAALMGLEVRELRVEATGSFNVARFVGVEDAAGPGYEGIELTVHLVADATEEQVRRLQQLCDRSSPVGDTLQRPVQVRTTFALEAARVT